MNVSFFRSDFYEYFDTRGRATVTSNFVPNMLEVHEWHTCFRLVSQLTVCREKARAIRMAQLSQFGVGTFYGRDFETKH